MRAHSAGDQGLMAAVNQAAVIATFLLLGTAAAVWAMAHDDAKSDPAVAGLYRIEPAARGNPTTTMAFVRFRQDGTGVLQLVDLHDDGTTLRAEVRPAAPEARSWSVDDDRICVAGRVTQCFGLRRDAVTGDLTLDDGTRLTRIRSQGFDYR